MELIRINFEGINLNFQKKEDKVEVNQSKFEVNEMMFEVNQNIGWSSITGMRVSYKLGSNFSPQEYEYHKIGSHFLSQNKNKDRTLEGLNRRVYFTSNFG